jgi:Ca-activated chloride channel homolog
MRLADPLFLLAGLVPLYFFFFRQKKSLFLVNSFSVPRAIRAFDVDLILRTLKLIGALLIVVALARPQSSTSETTRNLSGIDILMVMDVSASMNIEDLSEESRLAVAKKTMEGFIRGRQNDRIGFVIFSGEPLTLAPPTLDYGLVLQELRKVETGVLKDGTAIGDGLALAVNRLRNSTAKSRIIILLTDGDSNIGQVDPLTAGELASGYGIKVYTIAIGKEGRVRLPIRRKGFTGDVVTSYQWFDNALNPQLLQEISEKTKANFYRVQDLETLHSVFKEIDQLEKTELKITEKIRYEEKYLGILFLGLLLLMAETVLRRGVWRVLA